MANGGIERRKAARYKVRIAAQVTDLGTHATVEAMCSDISVSGCFLDTGNPSATGTPLRLRLEQRGGVFESLARVAYSVWAEGMGVAFETPVAQDKLMILKGWLADAAAEEAKSKALLSGIST